MEANRFRITLLHPHYWLTWCGFGFMWLLAQLPLDFAQDFSGASVTLSGVDTNLDSRADVDGSSEHFVPDADGFWHRLPRHERSIDRGFPPADDAVGRDRVSSQSFDRVPWGQ